MYLIQGSKELFKIVRWVAGVHFMHNVTYLQFIYVIHWRLRYLYSGSNLDLKEL